MSSKIPAVKGMNDLLPDSLRDWRDVEHVLISLSESYGFNEIRFPIVERTELFKRSIGDVTDIVQKEMYTFTDKNGDSLTLRPEGTAPCVRACLKHNLLYNSTQKLWYMGPMFRRERPQKGRYRQFFQFGIEAFGFSGIDIELELMLLSKQYWQALNLAKAPTLEINTIGSKEERQGYLSRLTEYLMAHKDNLDEDSQRRLDTNPLRILDSKNKKTQEILLQAPVLIDNLSSESQDRFHRLCENLTTLGIPFEVNHRLVRGLDYYSHTVFEWTTDELGAQGAILAGGRYDSLVKQCGGQDTYAAGFAIGLERLVLLYGQNARKRKSLTDVYVVIDEGIALSDVFLQTEKIRQALPHLNISIHHGGGSFKSQFKKADKSEAAYALVFAEEEYGRNELILKPLRSGEQQQVLPCDSICQVLLNELKDVQ